jgi:hypothetical protein
MEYEFFTLSQVAVPEGFTNKNYEELKACFNSLIPAQPWCNSEFTACLNDSACA